MKKSLDLNDWISIPEIVRKVATRGLTLRLAWGRGGTPVGLHTANLLAKSTHLRLAKVLHIAKYFPRHAGDRLKYRTPPSNGYIAWRLWGGNAGRRWASVWAKRWKAQ